MIIDAVPGWVTRSVEVRLAGIGRGIDDQARARVAAVAAQTATDLAEPVERALTADVDAGVGSPLAVMRAGCGLVTGLLEELGVPAVERDEFSIAHFPDDRHALGPATFGDIHDSLHEPGIVWGAARAHVHLRRRREAET